MQIEEGKYYKTRGGKKVGPFKLGTWGDGYPWDESTENLFYWSNEGKCQVHENGQNDLIAEWTDTPKRSAGTILSEIDALVAELRSVLS